MKSSLEKAKRLVTERYRRDISSLQAYWPQELFTLEHLLRTGSTRIKLVNGEEHYIDREQLEKLSRIIPKYLWELVKLPLLFRYERDERGRSWYIVLGDNWQKRAVELILTGKLTSEGRSMVGVEEFRRIIREFDTLVFVGLKV